MPLPPPIPTVRVGASAQALFHCLSPTRSGPPPVQRCRLPLPLKTRKAPFLQRRVMVATRPTQPRPLRAPSATVLRLSPPPFRHPRPLLLPTVTNGGQRWWWLALLFLALHQKRHRHHLRGTEGAPLRPLRLGRSSSGAALRLAAFRSLRLQAVTKLAGGSSRCRCGLVRPLSALPHPHRPPQ